MKKVFIYSLPLLIFLLASTIISAQTLDREEIDDKYKWNLEDLYSSVDEWRQDIAKIEGQVDEIQKYKGKLGEDPNNLLITLDTLYGIIKEFYRISSYAGKLRDQDLSNSENESLAQQAGNLGTKISETASFIDPEIGKDEQIFQRTT